ncbi:MAG: ATP-binding protein [Pseudomonadota bacterium]
MIPRILLNKLAITAGYYPVVLLDGPRQSGKTTLTRAAFPDKAYVTLEPLDIRDFARTDPRGFLSQYRGGAIIDEVQHAPDLLSYLQAEVDRDPTPGRFVLTGSQNLAISHAVSQSLAGRSGILHLLPFSREELANFPTAPTDLFELLWTGGYPRIYDHGIPAQQWLADYVATYVQRDVRQILNVGDLNRFTTFLRLCASHTAQELRLSTLGADAGVSHNTANAWLSVLESSFICARLPAWHRNINKQVVKAPKLHFFDTGLVCYLLGIKEPAQLRHHPLRGPIFETWVFSELYKGRIHRGDEPQLFHFRESRGLEVDFIERTADRTLLVEAKSGETIGSDYFHAMGALEKLLISNDASEKIEKQLVYGGSEASARSGVNVVPWHAL